MKQLDNDSTLKEWCDTNKLEHTKRGTYIQLSCIENDEDILDVILQDEVELTVDMQFE